MSEDMRASSRWVRLADGAIALRLRSLRGDQVIVRLDQDQALMHIPRHMMRALPQSWCFR